MNSSVTRTELFAFWYWVEWLSFPSRSMSNPASRRTRALRSSTALHQMKSRTSGWSTFRITIFAARRVLPPDLIVPALASAPRMKLTGPEAVPPPASGSLLERILLRLIPDPDPPLKIVPSSTYQLRIEDMRSSTSRMKHAEHCWGVSGTPTLNHTGELKAAFWFTSRWLSSSANTRASSSLAKYASFLPQFVMESTILPTRWRTLHSRCGVPRCPRKYFCETMFVAFCDQVTGNSTSRCSNALPPSL